MHYFDSHQSVYNRKLFKEKSSSSFKFEGPISIKFSKNSQAFSEFFTSIFQAFDTMSSDACLANSLLFFSPLKLPTIKMHVAHEKCKQVTLLFECVILCTQKKLER